MTENLLLRICCFPQNFVNQTILGKTTKKPKSNELLLGFNLFKIYKVFFIILPPGAKLIFLNYFCFVILSALRFSWEKVSYCLGFVHTYLLFNEQRYRSFIIILC